MPEELITLDLDRAPLPPATDESFNETHKAFNLFASSPGGVSEADWKKVQQFLLAELETPDNLELNRMMQQELGCSVTDFIGILWSASGKGILHLLIDQERHLVATAATKLISADGIIQRDDPGLKALQKRRALVHFWVAVRRDLRNTGIFKEVLYPTIEEIAKYQASVHGEITSILNVPPGDDGQIWTDRGFEEFYFPGQDLIWLKKTTTAEEK